MIRTTNSCCGNEAGLVEKFIGTAYDVVKTVYDNLGELQFIYDFLNKYGVLIAVDSVDELKALPTTAKYTRVYTFSTTAGYGYTDYLYVAGNVTGVIPNDPTATGSWIVVASSTAGGGGDTSGGGYIPWVYAQGSALGGETTIAVPNGTIGVPFIIVEGYMNTVGYGFTFDVGTLTVTLAQPLEAGDEVVLLLSGAPAVPDNPNISDWVVFNWLYNGGAAVGGEQVISIPYTFQSVPAIFKNGLRYYSGLATQSYTVDAANQRILLTEPLATNDRLIVQIGGESPVVVMSDRTIQEVARSVNVKDSEVILSTNTTQYLNGMKVIYSVTEQKSYGLPVLPTNVYIESVANGKLTYSPGSIVVDLLPAPSEGYQAAQALRAELATSVGAGMIGMPNGTVQDAIHYVTPEMFRFDTDTNDDQMFQRMWDYAIPANVNIVGDGEYHLANTYEVPEVHTPPVRYDFNMMTIKLRKVVYTSASGVAFINRSPGCVFEIGELAGTASFTLIDETIGFQLMGQGRIPNVIHVVHGFATNVKLDNCFTRAIYLGECYDSLRGVRCVVANANRIFGKIGGGFSKVAIDPTTCEVGITFDTSSNTNEVFANIEYCRRSATSRPFVDDGSTNSFFGYIESCNLPGQVNGPYARYQIKNGGDNTRSQLGYEVGGMQSQIEMLDDVVDNGVPVTVGNSTITFKNLQSALSKSSQAEVISKGSREIIAQGKVNQYIVSSNDLLAPQWNLAVGGAAQTSDLSITSGLLNGGASTQYRYGSRIVANREATESDYYVISQNVTAAFLREVSFGIALRMVEEAGYPGDADFLLKIQSTTGNILYSKAFRLTGNSKIIEHFHSVPTQFVDSDTYSIQLQIRTWKMSKIDIFNIHLCNGANIERAPAGVGTGPTPFQPIDKNAVGFLPKRVCKPISAPFTLKQYDFDTYIVEGTGNVTLSAGYDGQVVTFIRNGATEFNLLSTETIDGAGLTPMTDGMTLTIQFIEQLGKWVTVAK